MIIHPVVENMNMFFVNTEHACLYIDVYLFILSYESNSDALEYVYYE